MSTTDEKDTYRRMWEQARYTRQKSLKKDIKAGRVNRNRTRGIIYSTHTYIDCVVEEMAFGDSSLMEFFERLKDISDEFAEEDCLPVIKERDELIAKRMALLKLLNRNTKKIQETIRVEKTCTGEILYNGIPLKREVLEDASKAHFKEEYEKQHEKNNKEFLKDEKNIPKRILKLEKLRRFLPFGKEKVNMLIRNSIKRLEKIKAVREKEAKLKKQAEVFESLTPENKMAILEHMKIAEMYSSCVKEIQAKEREIRNIKNGLIIGRNGKKHNNSLTKEYRFSIALGRMLSSGEVTEEMLNDLYKKLDMVCTKASTGKYQFKYYNSASRKAKCLAEVVSWFVKDFYELDKNFENRNIKAEHEF